MAGLKDYGTTGQKLKADSVEPPPTEKRKANAEIRPRKATRKIQTAVGANRSLVALRTCLRNRNSFSSAKDRNQHSTLRAPCPHGDQSPIVLEPALSRSALAALSLDPLCDLGEMQFVIEGLEMTSPCFGRD
jgi:hypothetical protein